MSRSGPRARGASRSSQAPVSTRARPDAAAANASTRLVFPMPASPETAATRPAPPSASSRAECNAASAGPRSSSSTRVMLGVGPVLTARIFACWARLGGVHIRLVGPGDDAAVDEVVTHAFGDEGPTIVRLLGLLAHGGHRVAGLVADDDGMLLGHVQLSRSWVDARERLVEVLVLSPLS